MTFQNIQIFRAAKIIIPIYLCSRVISNLEENEAKKQAEVTLQQEFEEKLRLLTASYVEYLDEDYLFQQIFASDKDMCTFYFIVRTWLYLTITVYRYMQKF